MKEIASRDDGIGSKKLLYAAFALPVTLKEYLPINCYCSGIRRMVDFNDTHKSVLERYSRPIVHMRNQIQKNRFGLIFGAGLSHGCQIPTWGKLVEALADDPEVDGKAVLQGIHPRAGLPYQTEMLFEHFKHRRYNAAATNEHNTRALDFDTRPTGGPPG